MKVQTKRCLRGTVYSYKMALIKQRIHMKTVSFFKPHTVSQPVVSFPAWTALQQSTVRTLRTQTRKREVDCSEYFSVINRYYFVIFVSLNSKMQ